MRIVTLTPDEAAELDSQDPSTEADGGFQGLFVKSRRQYVPGTREISLYPQDVERIGRYVRRYGGGGWEGRLYRAFRRTLGTELGWPM